MPKKPTLSDVGKKIKSAARRAKIKARAKILIAEETLANDIAALAWPESVSRDDMENALRRLRKAVNKHRASND